MELTELKDILHRVCGHIYAEPQKSISNPWKVIPIKYPWHPVPFYIKYEQQMFCIHFEPAYDIITKYPFTMYANLFKDVLDAHFHVIKKVYESTEHDELPTSIVEYSCNDENHIMNTGLFIPDKKDELFDKIMESVHFEIKSELIRNICSKYGEPHIHESCINLFTMLKRL